MNIKTCRHCDRRFIRPDAAPIPHDRCERCHEGIEALGGPLDDPIEMQTFGPLKVRAGGLKFDADKPRMELLIQGMPRALEEVGRVLTFGAQKYAAHSWKHVEDNQNRYWAAKGRHELARAKGEQSGRAHDGT